MLVFTAIVAPRAAIVELLDVVESAFVPEPAAAAPRKSFVQRLLGTPARPAPTPPSPYDAERGRAHISELFLPVAKLGNLTKSDLLSVTASLRETLASVQQPTVSFSGSGAVESATGPQVWAQLVGDLTELRAVAQAVQATAQDHGIMVDRRLFHPWLELQDLVGPVSGPQQERLLAALDRFVGQPWTIEGVSLMTRTTSRENPEVRELEHLPLATPDSFYSGGQ